MSDKRFDLVIVGGGVAGMYACVCAGMRKLKTGLIEYTGILGGKLNTYLNKEIYDIPLFKSITADMLLNKLKSQLEEYNSHITYFFNDEIKSIVKENDYYRLVIKNEEILAKYILLTSGTGLFKPRKIGTENDDAVNIIYSVNDRLDFFDKKVIILGGGDSAVDYCLMLQDTAKEIHLIHRRNEFRAKDGSLDRLNDKVIINTPYDVVGLNKKGVKIKSVIIKNKDNSNTETIGADYIIVCYGNEKQDDIFTGMLKRNEKGIIVNEKYQTSEKSIFAIGDACTYDAKYKNITSCFGEGSTVINYIGYLLNPEKMGIYYSSLNKK